MATAQKQPVPTPVRLPDDLKIWLKHKAVDNDRSLNQEISGRLVESRKREEAGDGIKAS